MLDFKTDYLMLLPQSAVLHTRLNKNFQERVCLSSFVAPFPFCPSEKKGALPVFLGSDPRQQACGTARVALEGAPASQTMKHSSLLFTFASGDDFTTPSFKVTVVHVQGLRTCRAGSHMVLQSPSSWCLICSLGPAILENERYFPFD